MNDKDEMKRTVLKSGMVFITDGICGWIKFNMDADLHGTEDLAKSLTEIKELGYEKFAIEICMKHQYVSYTEMQFRFIPKAIPQN